MTRPKTCKHEHVLRDGSRSMLVRLVPSRSSEMRVTVRSLRRLNRSLESCRVSYIRRGSTVCVMEWERVTTDQSRSLSYVLV